MLVTSASTALALGVFASNSPSVDGFVPAVGGRFVQRSTSHTGEVWARNTNAVRPHGGSRRPSSTSVAAHMSLAERPSPQQSKSSSPSHANGHHLDDHRFVKPITGGLPGFMRAVDASVSGDLVVIVTYMPWCRSCKMLRHRLRYMAEDHEAAESGARFFEMDLNSNADVHEMLDIHAAPTVLLYSSGNLVDEIVCGGETGPKVLARHIAAQIGPVPALGNMEREDLLLEKDQS